jgi:hypothetical protein
VVSAAPLRPAVREELRRHGIESGPSDTPAALRERLNERYLEEVRKLRARQVQGEIPRRDYAGHVTALKERFPLLGLPLDRWGE